MSQNISLFGSSVVSYAILWHITLETSSGFWLMLSTLCSVGPQVLVSLWGGVWADRYNRKHLIMLADGFIALATLGLAIAFLTGHGRMELILAVSAVRSVGAGIQTPAVSAIYPQLVPEAQLARVQGINQTMGSVLLLLSPAVGGIVLGSMGLVWTFFIDVVTAATAILVMAFIHVQKHVRTEEVQSTLQELKRGLSYTISHPLLLRLLICYAFSYFLITPAAILSPLMVERTFGSDVWRLTASEIVWTVGSLLGGIFISVRGEFKNKVRTVAICLVAFGVCFALVGVPGISFLVFLALMGIAGAFMPVMYTTQTVFIQQITEPDVLGRVFSIIQILSVSAVPVGILLFGPLADVVSVESIMLVSGILLALVGVLYNRSNRGLTKS